jgi:hypothetical protein
LPGCDPINPFLHLLDCVGQQPSTIRLVNQSAQAVAKLGTSTSIHVSATLDGSPLPGPLNIRYSIASTDSTNGTTQLSGIIPGNFYDRSPTPIPTGTYRLTYSGGGPTGNVSVLPSPTQTIGVDHSTGANSWNLSFVLAFHSTPPPVIVPSAVSVAFNYVSGDSRLAGVTISLTSNPAGVSGMTVGTTGTCGWLAASLSGASAPANLILSPVGATTLAVGSYICTVNLNGATSGASGTAVVQLSIPVSITINAQPPPVPNWTLKSPANSPAARYSPTIVYDAARGQVVLFDYISSTPYVAAHAETWVWDGTNWTQKSPTNSPTERYDFAMAYDGARGQVVLFGGHDRSSQSQLLAETWVWDGMNWTQKSPTNSPTARVRPNMVYDAARAQVVLFGGANNALSNETWVWDGANWAQKHPANSPTGRVDHAMAYDASHGEVVLFGGLDPTIDWRDDTWIWDGTNWTHKSPANNPPARDSHAMAYDATRSQVVLFGGGQPVIISSTPRTGPSSKPGIVAFDDTWAWDGVNWSQKSPASIPPARYSNGMAWDSARNQVVLFGGRDIHYRPLNDTWVWPNALPSVILPVLSVSKTHTGNFTQGQAAATYTVTVSNQTGVAVTGGPLTVIETMPNGLTLVSMSGTGWTCPSGGVGCTRSDAVAAGASYPAITVTVNVAANAPAQVTNQVAVSAAGFDTAQASDATLITSATQTIAFPALNTVSLGVLPFNVSATASSGLAVTFASNTLPVCTMAGSTVTILAAGTCMIAATQPGNTAYAAATPVTQTFIINQVSQGITFENPGTQTLGAAPPALSATATSGLPVAVASNSPSICAISATALTLVSAGTCSITASQPGNSTYAASTVVTQTFAVNQATQTITFGPLDTRTIGTPPPALGATATSGLTVSFASTSPAVCSVAGTAVSLITTGNCSIVASQPGTATYAAATPVTRTFLVSSLTAQSITFGALATQTIGTPPTTLSATASSGLAVSYASNSQAVCTVTSTTVTLVAAGTCSITASQNGNAAFAAATSVTQTFNVSLVLQTISFGSLSTQTLGSAVPPLSATVTSTLPVTFTSNSTSVCTVAGSGVTLVSAGICSITASQPGDANYAAAAPVTRTFIVAKVAQTITFGPITTQTFGAAPPLLNATASSNLAVTFASNNPIVCTVAGTAITLLGVGTCSITASQSGSAGYVAAPPLTQTFTVSSSPCDINIDGFTNVADVQLIINEALGVTIGIHDLNHDGAVNVADVQKVINAALGLGCPVQ